MKMRVSHFHQHAAVIPVTGISANKPAEGWQSFNDEVNVNEKVATHIRVISRKVV